MEAVKIIFISAIIFPFVATAGVMIFVARAMRKHKIEKEKLLEVQDLNETLENVIISQDNLLDGYRKILK